MKVKASLHLHSQEDQEDGVAIKYSLFGLIDRAAELDFKVLASTCHGRNVCRPEHISYAAKKGILLIPGLEANINGRQHILILNGGEPAENVATFEELKNFKVAHPESFIIAPHPNHGPHSLTLAALKQLGNTVDAVEHSWYYTSSIDPNLKAQQASQELGLPFIATSDAHTLDYLNIDYALLDLESLTPQAVFGAIRAGRFENFSRAKNIGNMIGFIIFLLDVRIASIYKKR